MGETIQAITLSLFTNDMIIYLENIKKFTRQKTLKLSKFSKITVNILKLIIFHIPVRIKECSRMTTVQ